MAIQQARNYRVEIRCGHCAERRSDGQAQWLGVASRVAGSWLQIERVAHAGRRDIAIRLANADHAIGEIVAGVTPSPMYGRHPTKSELAQARVDGCAIPRTVAFDVDQGEDPVEFVCPYCGPLPALSRLTLSRRLAEARRTGQRRIYLAGARAVHTAVMPRPLPFRRVHTIRKPRSGDVMNPCELA
jgi:hypothetical protein